MTDAPRPPLPPFTVETAALKARAAEDAWNSRDPARVSLTQPTATAQSLGILQGRDAIKAF
jgi:nuclear transport factor 2 (NTF2) superfamily protein